MEKNIKRPELVAEDIDMDSSEAIDPEEGPPASRPYPGLHADVEEQDNIRSLARTLTSASSAAGINYQPGTKEELDFIGLGSDPRLDPHSDAFESEYWVRSIRRLFVQGSDHYKPAELGIAVKGLRIMGQSADADFQTTVANWPVKLFNKGRSLIQGNNPDNMFDIIKPLDAIFQPGRVCVVLGRPGAGCSSLLKTVAVRTYGLTVAPESEISYDGITPSEIMKNFRGDVIYSAESDSHFASLPVGYTLEFAARCRCPSVRFGGISREEYYKHYAAVVMAMYGLTHTYNTKVGDNYVRGVSGGERKRVSLAEVTLAGAKIQCWDNSTRGLDSATALEFVRAIKTNAEVMRTTSLIAIYQCSQETYDQFDDVLVLYEGYEIFFGSAGRAKDYFLEMGWHCPERQTTADFLTSVTAPAERRPRKGYEDVVPTTPKEFYQRWLDSPERAEVLAAIDEHSRKHSSGFGKQQLAEHHRQRQSKNLPVNSSYLISFGMQVRATVDRNWMRLKGDPSVYLFMIISNSLMGLIVASTFFNQKSDTASFYYRGSALFTAVLFNSFSSILEIISLFEARSIVEKHKTYAFYHPSADALASIITQLPAKIAICVCFNLVFYFMTNLRRSAGAFFFYLLISLTSTFAMSHLFRTLGAACTTLYYAMTPASILLLIISVYVGFSIPKDSIHGWSKWLYYLNPIARSMEAMTANEFHGRNFTCSNIIPSGAGYENTPLENQVCTAVGSIPGSMVVSGTRYIALAYDYHASHMWRNWAIVLAYAIFFLVVYLVLIEYNKGEMQKGEVIVFLRSQLKKLKRDHGEHRDLEAQSNEKSESSGGEIERIGSDDIFHWRDVCYDVQIKKETRRILNSVDGYIKPGSLTALMGCSGAGKTTLLDVLANRTTTGVISGNMFVNGRPRDEAFQRSTGYCQQQDLHLRTQTVREAMQFSAYLRQPSVVPKAEKDAYVEDIIHLLEMDAYADAVVGEVGEGLNVEQRKRLTIGVELVARPGLLLFLDEPTSGLDSQTAWSICQLIRKLADRGQAIVCTIHQPSSILMEFFDRLLLLQSGGKTVYFGDLGKGCNTMIEYFEKYGSQKFPKDCNPADFMLEVIGAAPGSHAKQNYHEVWKNSEEYRSLQEELKIMETELVKRPVADDEYLHREFASTFWEQYKVVTKRVFVQYWRTPGYIWSKVSLGVFSALFVGFSFFKASNSMQGLQNQMFATFTFLMICTPLIQQMLPQFFEQRSTYEVRERPSKTFRWQAFLLAQVTVESVWAIFVGTVAFFCFYYPIGFGHNAIDHTDKIRRAAFTWLLAISYYVFSITLGQFCAAAVERDESADNMANFFFMICIIFCGVLVSKDKMPGFWIWLYRISPLTYVVSALLSTGVGKSEVKCSAHEYVSLNPPSGMSCGQYLDAYMQKAAGYLLDPSAMDRCTYCPMSKTDNYLAGVNIYFKHRYRDWAIFLCFIITNILGFIFLYWYFRVPKSNLGRKGLFGKSKSK